MIEKYAGKFERIVFAITGKKENYQAFSYYFPQKENFFFFKETCMYSFCEKFDKKHQENYFHLPICEYRSECNFFDDQVIIKDF